MDSINNMESKFTYDVINKLKPRITEIQKHMKTDVRSAVREEKIKMDIPPLI